MKSGTAGMVCQVWNKWSRLLVVAIAMIMYLSLCLLSNADAIDQSVKTMLQRATGISDDDVKSIANKKELTLFDAYALAVHNTERLAMEGENSIQAGERKLQAIETFLPYFSLRANKECPPARTRYISIARSRVSL